MNIIIDTHIFLWALSEPNKLTSKFRSELETPANRIFISAVSLVEIMIKASLGKLEVDFDPLVMAEKTGFDLLSFSPQDALPLKHLPFHHKDPFDRMLISQGLSRGFKIMTQDSKFAQYDCKLV